MVSSTVQDEERGRRAEIMSKGLFAVMVMVAALAASGCVVETVSAPPPGVAVSGPPPPPRFEERPAPPSGRMVWVGGYWHWTGMQYAWIPGHWEQERPGAIWRAPRYSLREGVYFYEPGGWWVPPPPR
jgi:hypothetical protein